MSNILWDKTSKGKSPFWLFSDESNIFIVDGILCVFKLMTFRIWKKNMWKTLGDTKVNRLITRILVF